MNLMNKNTIEYGDRLMSIYAFDKLNTVSDVFEILKILIESGVQVNFVKVTEFSDYDEEKKIIIYKNLEAMSQIAKDFTNRVIEEFYILGRIGDYKIYIEIYPDVNKMQITYIPLVKDYVDGISNRFSR